MIIAAILHDICKAGMLIFNPNGKPGSRKVHIPGHGNRSVKLLEKVCQFKLTDDERRAIRWHMRGLHHTSDYAQHDLDLAHQSRLWQIVHDADHKDAAIWGKDKGKRVYAIHPTQSGLYFFMYVISFNLLSSILLKASLVVGPSP